MFLFKKPTPEQIRDFIADQSKYELTYDEIGYTAGKPPAIYSIDRVREQIGKGEAAYQAACQALRGWKQFDLGWTEVANPDTPIEDGRVVAMLGRAPGVWSLNACKIVYSVDEIGPPRRFGFAYGTLPDHVCSGEELFRVEWNPADDIVWYEIFSFSKPHQLLAALAYPFFRAKQKQFKSDTVARMREIVEQASCPP